MFIDSVHRTSSKMANPSRQPIIVVYTHHYTVAATYTLFTAARNSEPFENGTLFKKMEKAINVKKIRERDG